MNVTKEIARKYVAKLEHCMREVPTELIFNPDEVGSQEWADRKSRSVLIPRQFGRSRAGCSVLRAEKRIRSITTISMTGRLLMPLLVIHCKTIDDAVWEKGWRQRQNFLIRSNDTSYATRDIFGKDLTDAESTRPSLSLHDFPAVLLHNYCSSHIDDEIMQLLASHNVKLLTFPPLTSNMFQPLDLVTIAVLQREKREIQVTFASRSQVECITRIMKALKRASDCSANRSAFRGAGLTVNPNVCEPVAMVNSPEVLTGVKESALSRSEPAIGDNGCRMVQCVPAKHPFSDFWTKLLSANPFREVK
jgi:hypothetical protein